MHVGEARTELESWGWKVMNFWNVVLWEPQKVLEQANGVTEEACYNYLSQQGGQKRVRLAEADVISKGSGLHRIFWGHHYKGCFGSILLISSPYHPPPQASGYYFLAPPASC